MPKLPPVLALAAMIGPVLAGTDNASHCIASAESGGHYTLMNRCRFDVDLRYCSLANPRARCGDKLGKADIKAGASLRITIPAGDRLRYAACPWGDEIEVKWLALRNNSATGLTIECLSVGD